MDKIEVNVDIKKINEIVYNSKDDEDRYDWSITIDYTDNEIELTHNSNSHFNKIKIFSLDSFDTSYLSEEDEAPEWQFDYINDAANTIAEKIKEHLEPMTDNVKVNFVNDKWDMNTEKDFILDKNTTFIVKDKKIIGNEYDKLTTLYAYELKHFPKELKLDNLEVLHAELLEELPSFKNLTTIMANKIAYIPEDLTKLTVIYADNITSISEKLVNVVALHANNLKSIPHQLDNIRLLEANNLEYIPKELNQIEKLEANNLKNPEEVLENCLNLDEGSREHLRFVMAKNKMEMDSSRRMR